MSVTLSFCIFKHLKPVYGPKHYRVNNDLIKNTIILIKNEFREKNYLNEDINFLFNDSEMMSEDDFIHMIFQQLFLKNEYHINNYKKIYAIAFAINYKKFFIESNGYLKKVI